MLEAIIELILGVFMHIGDWFGWRFWAPPFIALILGFIIVPFVPPGTATTATISTLLVLGMGGGVVWRIIGGRH